MTLTTKTKSLIIERVERDGMTVAFRAVFMDRDEDTGARSVFDIMEAEKLEVLLRCIHEDTVDELYEVDFRNDAHLYVDVVSIYHPEARKMLRRLANVMVGATPRTAADAVTIVRHITDRKIKC
jgi:hypothetical protein